MRSSEATSNTRNTSSASAPITSATPLAMSPSTPCARCQASARPHRPMTSANQPGMRNFRGVGLLMGDTLGGSTEDQLHLPPEQEPLPSGTPSFLNRMPGGQKPVMPDWNRLKPAKAVSARNHSLTKIGLPA